MVQQDFQKQPSASRAGQPQPNGTQSISAPAGFWSQLTARVRGWFEVPFGYEDEQGFHYGQQPAPKLASPAMSSRARVLTDRADQMMRHSVVLPVAHPPDSPSQPANPEQKAEAVHV